MESKPLTTDLLQQLFRAEYAKMTTGLYRRFGLQHMETAEDIVSETFLKASEVWNLSGVPDHAKTWLYTVAGNKAKDHLKRVTLFDSKIKELIDTKNFQPENDFDFKQQSITDSQLAMIFAVCNPAINQDAQIALALQILCGFQIEEIADSFLTKKETIKKRLQRAKSVLRIEKPDLKHLSDKTVSSRLDTVLRTLYLLFNDGYFSKTGSQLIRKDLCSEAIRLCLILTENRLTNVTRVKALLALMCYQCSRLDARIDQDGEAILFEEQDKGLWSKELIELGNYYLVNACSGNEISKYHLEAGIAYWHTTLTVQDKWPYILQLYNQLILIEYSPQTALNRAFAYAKVFGNRQGVIEALKLNLTELKDFHALLGFLYTGADSVKAIAYYQQAYSLSRSMAEKAILKEKIWRLSNTGREGNNCK